MRFVIALAGCDKTCSRFNECNEEEDTHACWHEMSLNEFSLPIFKLLIAGSDACESADDQSKAVIYLSNEFVQSFDLNPHIMAGLLFDDPHTSSLEGLNALFNNARALKRRVILEFF
jgi:hypothetical protein